MFSTLGRRALPGVTRSRFGHAGVRRTLAEDASKPAVSAKPPSRGAGLLSRISSFLVGAGLTALATQFYIFQELREGNKIMIAKQKELDARLKKLEGN
ncbi:hypothetical protein IV203_008800 [Nitzschia inconspicua]|uniref:Uncharacterized protein n=1 Tax=Nitzschia inconspicua TaxID=303405 RepID=A0A9K3PMD8_9STRA|nr:hypothetical protein IV203_008800 [Nitzschia inconspicua]